ncbi:glycosyltransferase family 1 protein [Butyrivibrio sp.]|uniref:glycosyltransferase family 4 protein n=1 Tax=Butyrivibrio sp. TaxID=28121 RepID=UPI0025C1A617|nr:glycosyltransferase family 1 protein [Butyrivibrio sp.]MBQ9304640.1 glycosyltransferase family 4 protein [Butyrivibrio sp.]
MDKNVFAVDLLWLRVGKNGGSETFIRNVLDGMRETDREFEAVLLVAQDNGDSFKHYSEDKRFIIHECPIDSLNNKKRLAWQNLHLRDTLKKMGIKKCFEPIYSVPFIRTKGVDFYTVIHDLQAKHFPSYFSKSRRVFMDYSWRNSIRRSKRIIAISDFAKEDITTHYPSSAKKIIRIYNPISVREIDEDICKEAINDLGIISNGFFLCISSLLPHKNLKTIIRMMALRDDDTKLVIVGVGGALETELREMIEEKGLTHKVQILSYISDEKRDALYKKCSIFLFPSIFEGFGMPPVEAMLMDKPVITTRCTSIPEVTRGEAIYVDDASNEEEWNDKTNKVLLGKLTPEITQRTISSSSNPYSKKKAALQYLDLLSEK